MKPEDVIPELFSTFPELSHFLDKDEGTYCILGDFGLYLRDGITENTIDNNALNKAFDFLNALGKSDDPEVQNLLGVGVLEILTDRNKTIQVSKKMLKGQALEIFNKTIASITLGVPFNSPD